jgi:GntR family transcriptional regulator/MocR family aminotransferase
VNTAEEDTAEGSDFLQLDIGDAPPGRRSDWLASRLRHAISDGRLPVGSKLPATRALAADLKVSRGVVTEAYQRLVEDGHVAAAALPLLHDRRVEAAVRSRGTSISTGPQLSVSTILVRVPFREFPLPRPAGSCLS